MDDIKVFSKYGNEQLMEEFYFRKDNHRYNSCKHCIIKKGNEWRIKNNEKTESYSREHFQQNKKENIEKRKRRRHTNLSCRLIHKKNVEFTEP